MQTIDYRFIDKSAWANGPWKSEIDKRQWQDATTGLPCLIVRNPYLGILCGYVGVPKDHPLFECDYDACPINVHGGLTYSSFCANDDTEHGICHRPDSDETDHVWWLGFDAGHFGDLIPGMFDHIKDRSILLDGFVYRDISYIEAECAELAQQIAALANK